ncbi:nuclease EXOG, mitochondrial [Hydra vulgaris]|uniref:Nuclease EXOG, mitochondrial n=1 Tax=Hydra vulgaris TaxID=6087 RepID=A0ABM4D3P9_HYDVU
MAANFKWFSNRKVFRHPSKISQTISFLAGLVIGSGVKEIVSYIDLPIKFKSNSHEGNIPDFSVNEEIFSPSTKPLLRYGLPQSPSTLVYSNHVVQYDCSRKVPLWVAQHITKEKLTGLADRSSFTFKTDVNVPEKFRATNEDFLNSGYTRGHMIPAADSKRNSSSMKESFLLSNIVPQNFENNVGFWYRLEAYCRSLSKRFSDVYVISGPLFLSENTSQNEPKFIKYQVIGKNEVAVPTHLYKVILVENNNKPRAIGAFIIPNQPISDEKTLLDYQVKLEDLEKLAGFNFFPKLVNLNRVGNLCLVDGCKTITKAMADTMNFSRTIKKVKSIEELDMIWKSINEKNKNVDKKLIDEYWKKKEALKNAIKPS